MSFIISVDGTCDTERAQLAAFDVKRKKRLYRLDGVPFHDNLTLDNEYETLERALLGGADLTCVPPTPIGYEDYFDELLEMFDEDIVHICVGSTFSADYDCAMRALKNEAIKFPKRQLYVVNGNTLSAGLDLLVDRAVTLKNDGLSAAEAFIELSRVVLSLTTLIAPSSADALIKNGLVPQSVGAGKTLSPLPLFALKEGKPILVSRYKGYASLSQRVLKEAASAKLAFVSHSGLTSPTRELAARLPVEITRTGLFTKSIIGARSAVIAFEK